MQPRLTEAAIEQMRSAIESLPVPQVVRDGIGWDTMPALTPDGLTMVPMIILKVPGALDPAGDPVYVLHTGIPGVEVHESQAGWNEAVRRVYSSAQAECDERATWYRSHGNGHERRSPGGLHLPGR